jgi:hypothetical protein
MYEFTTCIIRVVRLRTWPSCTCRNLDLEQYIGKLTNSLRCKSSVGQFRRGIRLLWSLIAPGRINHLQCLRIRFQIILATLCVTSKKYFSTHRFQTMSLGSLLELRCKWAGLIAVGCTLSQLFVFMLTSILALHPFLACSFSWPYDETRLW